MQVIVAIGSIRRPGTEGGYQPYQPNFRLENETVTIDFSSNDNKCPNTGTRGRPEPVSTSKRAIHGTFSFLLFLPNFFLSLSILNVMYLEKGRGLGKINYSR